MKRSLQHTLMFSLALLGFNTVVGASDLVSTNDLIRLSESAYEVSGNDPFLVVELDRESIATGDIMLDLGDQISDVSLELFFKNTATAFETYDFDPYYKASYFINRFPVKLTLPSSALTRRQLRIDLVDCPSCRLDLTNVMSVENTMENAASIEPLELLNGLNQLNPNGRKIELRNWLLNDLDGALTEFKIVAGDPHLISPKLNLSTEGLAGVYFKLKSPVSNQAWDDYQFFYQTEHHGFSLNANSNMRISKGANSIQSDITEFFIPLDFLSQDFPATNLIEKIRLDLPLLDGRWSLLESKLIHESELEQYQALRPNQLIQTKLHRATGLRLLKKSFFNVWADRGFVLVYLAMITVLVVTFVGAFRRDS